MPSIEISQLPLATTLLADTSIAVENSNVTQRILAVSIKSFVSNLDTLAVAGNITAGNVTVSGKFYGNIATPSQTAITTVGNLTGLRVEGTTNTANILPILTNTYNLGSTANVFANVYAGNLIATTFYGSLAASSLPGVTSLGTLTGLSVSGVTTQTGNLVITSESATTNLSTGALVVMGGAAIAGNIRTGGNLTVTGQTTLNSTTTFNSALISAVGTASTSTSTGAIVITNSGGLGVAGTVNAGEYRSTNGYFWANGAVYAPPVVPTGSEYSFQYKIGANFIGANNLKYWPVTSNIIISGGSVSTSANTGVLVVRGGIGVDGNLNISQGADGNAVVAQGRVYGSNVTVNTGVFWSNGTVFSGRGIPGNTEGAIQYNNGDTFAGSDFLRFDAANTNVIISGGTASANTSSGALIVDGGIGVSGTVNANLVTSNQGFFWSNGAIFSGEGIPQGEDYEFQFKTGTTFSGATGFRYTSNIGNIVLATTTPSSNVSTGAFVVKGGIGVAGNIVGNTIISENGYFWSNGVAYSGPAFGTGSDTNIQYNDEGALAGAADFTYIRANGNVVIGSTTASYTNNTGALVVKGGTAVQGNLYIAGSAGNAIVTTGLIHSGAITVTGNVNLVGSGVTTTANTAYLFDTASTIRIGANATTIHLGAADLASVRPTANLSTDLGTPSLYWNNLYVGLANVAGIRINNSGATSTGQVLITNAGTTTNKDTGALVVAGGIGVGGNIYIDNGGQLGPAATMFGNLLITGNIVPGTTGTYSIGSPGRAFTTVYARATSAQYADLAEIYVPDRHYEPGTVVVFGGDREITETTADHDPRVAGVISTNPAYLMNSAAEGLPVALTGRVPCKVIGPISKGDVLVTSRLGGVAQRMLADRHVPGCILGKSLQNVPNSEIVTIEIVVGKV
jgi:hypothetical protein